MFDILQVTLTNTFSILTRSLLLSRHWGWDQMFYILHMKLSNIFQYWLEFDWVGCWGFDCQNVSINPGNGLSTEQAINHFPNQWWLSSLTINAPPGIGQLRNRDTRAFDITFTAIRNCFIRKSKDYVYGIWEYKALGIWKGYYRVKKITGFIHETVNRGEK